MPVASSSTSTTTLGAVTSTTRPGGEQCGNSIDDDGDDLTDCQDPDCAKDPACPNACPAGPTFASIDCRLDSLIARVETTPGIQAEAARLIVGLIAARQAEVSARTSCLASDAKHTRKSLGQCTRRLQQYVKRLRGRSARRTILPLLRADLMDVGDALRSDAKTLRATAECPTDAR